MTYFGSEQGDGKTAAFQEHVASEPAEPPPRYPTHFASLSLHMNDRLRALQFPDEIIRDMRGVILNSWRLGIQGERIYAGSHEFKLRGNPWLGQSADARNSSVLMREILAFLFANGWSLEASVDISRKQTDKDMLVFRKHEILPPRGLWAAISFNNSDLMRFNGPEGQEEVVPALRHLLQEMRVLQSEGLKSDSEQSWEFKLRGYPWLAIGEETMQTRLLMLRMLETLESLGWRLYASIDQNVSIETDNWYLVKSE
jgi:hypothetical protein